MPTAVLPDGAASIWVSAMRVCQLDANGFINPGAPTYSTNALVKIDSNPVLETGDDIAIKNASGDLSAFAKHGDIPKYHTIQVELATPDPVLEQVLVGGITYSDSTAALGAPTGLTVTPQITGGSLPAGTYGYKATQSNAYGETIATADVSGSVASGVAGSVVLSGLTLAGSALYGRIYGRTIGGEQLIGSIPNIGAQTTAAASGTGAVNQLTVAPLTKSIPVGTTFQLSGDTNTPKVVFTAIAFAGVGAVTVSVSTSATVATTIASGASLQPVFVDTGAITPTGYPSQSDTTAGPGIVGYQAPALGIVANTNGVSIEAWGRAIVNGSQATVLPFYRWVFPKVTGMHTGQRTLTNANTQSMMEGQGTGNPNWGTGPVGDWTFDSSRVQQRARCGALTLPAGVSNSAVSVPALV
jgi:hypothetical protein